MKTNNEEKPSPALAQIEAGERGLKLQSMDEMVRFAHCVFASGLAPKGLASQQSIVVALQMGLELGMTPMSALQNICVINGRPLVWGDAALALCQASPVFDHARFSETWIRQEGKVVGARCEAARVGDPEPRVWEYTLDDAKTAGLLGKDNWKTNTKRMLQMRARAFVLRDKFSDILKGIRVQGDGYEDYPVTGAAGATGIAHLDAVPNVVEASLDMGEPPSEPVVDAAEKLVEKLKETGAKKPRVPAEDSTLWAKM